MRIVLAQISSTDDPTHNLAIVATHVRDAAEQGARLIVFPEATMCRFGVPLGPIAESVDGRWADGVRTVAGDAGVTVVAGMFCPAGDGRITNTLLATGGGVAAALPRGCKSISSDFSACPSANEIGNISVSNLGCRASSVHDREVSRSIEIGKRGTALR